MEHDTERSSPLQAVTDTMQKLTGALTGHSLEERIHEYTSVYAEILLGMHDQLRDMESENRTLRRENAENRRRLASLEARLGEISGRNRPGSALALAGFILSIASLVAIVWLILKPTSV